MKKLAIYEPAMCCDTGICGVSVDPELLRISAVINNLKKNGIAVERYNLTNAPMAFVDNKVVNEKLNVDGVDSLPYILLDDAVVIAGRYPTNDEIIDFLQIPATYVTAGLDKLETEASDCCCGETSDCCGDAATTDCYSDTSESACCGDTTATTDSGCCGDKGCC